MQYRQLGKTGISVSEIGFGAWGIGGAMWKGSDDDESMNALRAAIKLGINFFDTALGYGDGHSERLLGQLLQESGEQLYIATKIPPKNLQWPARPGVPAAEAFPKEYIIECTERSLKNLRRDFIDVQQFHVWSDEWADTSGIWEAVDVLKRQGKIRAFGISINDHEPQNALEAARSGMVDTFQVIYNIFDQSPAEEFFPYCLQKGIGIIVRVPFDEGGLTGRITARTEFPDGDWRNRYFQGERKQLVAERVEKLKPLLGLQAKTLPELALRFCLSHPAVSCVIAGMRTTSHVEVNAAVSDGKPLSPALLDELKKKHSWARNFYS